MIVTKINIVGLRVFELAELSFQPGMNLIVGVNGVGKSTVLDALRFCLSRIIPEMTVSRNQKVPITDDDIRFGADVMQLSCDFLEENQEYNYIIHKPRFDTAEVTRIDTDEKKVVSTPDIEGGSQPFVEDAQRFRNRNNQPVVLFFSTRRSFTVDQKPSNPQSGQAAAYQDAFSINRDFNIREIANWLKAQEALGEESPVIKKTVGTIQQAVRTFMPGYDHLHVDDSGGYNRLMLNKGAETLYVKQLSDGERGVLSIVIEIARRLAIANPELENPCQEGKGIILIDELDLHLHPRWQRKIVDNLTRTFPECQFIVSTHSPQIIPTVEPEQVQVIRFGEIIQPDRTYGMDSNWILKFIMEANDRPKESDEAIKKVEALINEGKFSKARQEMSVLRADGYDLPDWSVLEARMARMETIARKR